MNMQHLQALAAVAEYGSFSQAAKMTYVSQPNLSHQIKSLEKELGVQLFERSNPLTLTEAGTQCLGLAREILDRCEKIRCLARAAQENNSHSLKIGYVNLRTRELLIPRLRQFSLICPEAKADLQMYSYRQATEMLKNGIVDLIVTSQLCAEGEDWAEIRLIQESGLMATMSRHHPLARRTALCFEDLKEQSLILRKRQRCPEEYDSILEECRQHGFYPRITAEELTAENFFTRVEIENLLGISGGGMLLNYYTHDLIRLPVTDSRACYGVVLAWRKNDLSFIGKQFCSYFVK